MWETWGRYWFGEGRGRGPVGGMRGTQIGNWYVCAAQGLKMGGLGERPLTENVGLSERLLTEKTGDILAKNNKETYIFFFFF